MPMIQKNPIATFPVASGQIVTVARGLDYPSRSLNAGVWVSCKDPLRVARPFNLRPTMTFAYNEEITQPEALAQSMQDDLDVDVDNQASIAEECEVKRGLLKRLLAALAKKLRQLKTLLSCSSDTIAPNSRA